MAGESLEIFPFPEVSVCSSSSFDLIGHGNGFFSLLRKKTVTKEVGKRFWRRQKLRDDGSFFELIEMERDHLVESNVFTRGNATRFRCR